jgi:NADH-ubiquinone oxidoreductase chain 5
VELVGPYGLEKIFIKFSEKITKLDISIVTSYALYVLIGLVFYLLTPYSLIIDKNFLIIIIYCLIYII